MSDKETQPAGIYRKRIAALEKERDALRAALHRTVAMLEHEKSNDDKECARVGLKPCETLASCISEARQALAQSSEAT